MTFVGEVIEGPCEVGKNSSGTHLTIDVNKETGLKLTVLIFRTPSVGAVAPARGMAAQGTFWSTHDDKYTRNYLGGVTAIDACWVGNGNSMRICAWDLKEHTEEPEAPAK